MLKLCPWILLAAGLCLVTVGFGLMATARADTLPDPTLEQRLADLEAYVNNGPRTAEVAGRIAGAGPGHNAWMM
ncbi:MAG TPA: hypothetical protein PKN95_00865, partial [Verrucomicrobiota bacterium]|nr:hypothetical protein [Verrucomicrobiota bacterium]